MLKIANTKQALEHNPLMKLHSSIKAERTFIGRTFRKAMRNNTCMRIWQS